MFSRTVKADASCNETKKATAREAGNEVGLAVGASLDHKSLHSSGFGLNGSCRAAEHFLDQWPVADLEQRCLDALWPQIGYQV